MGWQSYRSLSIITVRSTNLQNNGILGVEKFKYIFVHYQILLKSIPLKDHLSEKADLSKCCSFTSNGLLSMAENFLHKVH